MISDIDRAVALVASIREDTLLESLGVLNLSSDWNCSPSSYSEAVGALFSDLLASGWQIHPPTHKVSERAGAEGRYEKTMSVAEVKHLYVSA